MRLKAFFIITILFITFSCEENTAYKAQLEDPELFQSAMKKLTDVIVYDIFSPPVASRVYVYPSIAAYEVMAKAYPQKYESLAGQVSELTSIPDTEDELVNYHLAAIHAFLTIGKTMIFSENRIDEYRESLYKSLAENGLPSRVKDASLKYGEQVANHILDWAGGDMYKQTRTYPKYTVLSETEFWKPTPPDYMDGIEPHWDKIRTMVIDSARQFKPKEPHPIDLTDGTPFKEQLMEVYEVGNSLDAEAEEIAKFWDCNPYVSHHRGHAMFATKKITPGGHWIGIVAISTRKANSTFDETINAYARTSIALFDAFISCWDEKWRTIVVRPETLINEFIDEEWVPLLQTPPFPEYTSGHSVISRAAAVTLTDIYGDDFSFEDTTEMEYGLPVRSFNSFLEASEEAAISRLYGGIHYMMAIDNGVEQGENVGTYINQNLTSLKAPLAIKQQN
jgi:hypothetical protein